MRKTLNEKLKYFIKPGELLSMGKGAVKNIHINKKERKEHITGQETVMLGPHLMKT